MHNSRIGHQILKYKILAEIGQGGMSIVYKAKDMRLEREVALKVLHPFLVKNLESQKRLTREAQIAAQLQHPHILQVFDYSSVTENNESNELFIVTELVEGVTLKEFANHYAIQQVPELGAYIIWQIALALQHAHSLGVIHRDIKPENIMIRNDGVLKLMDFGIAQIKSLDSLTVTGTLLGSPAHMAPENIEGKAYDHRADIFSLTTVLYWLTTGEMPFSGNSPHTLLKAIVDGRFKPPQQISTRITDALNQIMMQGLSLQPEKRFGSAEKMANAIQTALLSIGLHLDSYELRQILANPATQIPCFKEQVIKSCLSEIEKKQRQKKTAEAMSLISRILAENPEDSRVKKFLATYEPSRRLHFALLWGVAFLSATLLSYTTYISNWFGNYFLKLKDFKKATEIAALILPDLEHNATEPFTELNNSEPRSTFSLIDPNKHLVEIYLSIAPYADIFLDGKLIKKNASIAFVKLKPGNYSFLFKHQFAVTEERFVKISPEDKEKKLIISLHKSKPAILTVHSDLDADIAVNGIYKGTSEGSLARPILISLPDKTHAIQADVVISKPGYETVVLNTRFVAGQKKTMQVNLVPIK